MVVKYFKIVVKSQDKKVLEKLKSWLDTQILTTDLNTSLSDEETTIYQDDLHLILYVSPNKDVFKYVNNVKNKLIPYNKTKIDSIKVEIYENCNHDDKNPHPCKPTEEYSWP